MNYLIRLLTCLSLLMLMNCFPAQKKQQIIFFGDSITQQGAEPGGFIPLIDNICNKEGLGDRFGFTGSGISGNKVYDLYLRLEEDVLAKHPGMVLIYIGVNDVWHKSSLGTGTDLDKFERFYQAIIQKLTENKIKVILCTPAVIGERTDNTNPQDGDMNQYSKIIRDIAARNHLTLVDLRKTFLQYDLLHNPDNRYWGILTQDGVHLNAKGNQLVADEMWKAIKSGQTAFTR